MELGDLVKDNISGQTGICIALTSWLYGCERATVQPRESKEGKPAESFCVDVAQCEVVEAQVIKSFDATMRTPARQPVALGVGLARPAGPTSPATRASDPTR